MASNRRKTRVENRKANNKAWRRLCNKLSEFHRWRLLAWIIFVSALFLSLLLGIIYDKTDIVPAGIYVLLNGAAIMAAATIAGVHFGKIKPLARKMENLNGAPSSNRKR